MVPNILLPKTLLLGKEVDRWIGADVAKLWSPKIAVLDNLKEKEYLLKQTNLIAG
jgi:hypothetical protein